MNYFKKQILSWILIFCSITNGCESYRDDFDITDVYNDLINRIVNDNYQNCFQADLNYDDLLESYLSKNINYDEYQSELDSLKKIRMNRFPECTLNLNDEIDFSNSSHVDISKFVSESLEDDFVNDFFGDVSIESIMDSILVSSNIPLENLSVPNVQLLPQSKEGRSPWGHGIGQLGLSKCFVNKIQTKAIVYYEFLCGPKCGKGEIVFMSRNKRIWQIEKSKNIWIY